ncbi:MAG: hypothetical protein U0Q18_36990 [Bryobacteraceae bacterium]
MALEKLQAFSDEKEREMATRKLLWLSHGHPLAALYGDDGEMQCARCTGGHWDYRRAPLDELLKQVLTYRHVSNSDLQEEWVQKGQQLVIQAISLTIGLTNDSPEQKIVRRWWQSILPLLQARPLPSADHPPDNEWDNAPNTQVLSDMLHADMSFRRAMRRLQAVHAEVSRRGLSYEYPKEPC